MIAPSLLAAIALSGAGPNLDVSVAFEKYVLPENGLEVILSVDKSLPIVGVNVWYHAGPLNEPPKRTGFAHLFEHLMFQGSAHVGDDQHFKLLDAAGATNINGTTDFDRTNYFETVPRNQLELALWLESDRMGFLKEAMTQEKLDNQRQVVMNERRQSVENRPYGLSEEKMVQSLLPPEHPYFGNVMGSMADLGAAKLEDVQSFYDHFYAPANATIAIVGDIDLDVTKAMVKKYFATLPRRDAPKPRAIVPPSIPQERRATVKEPVQLPRLSFGWLAPAAYQAGDADADVLSSILGGGKSSRLYQRLVYELELAQDVEAQQDSEALLSMFTVTVIGRPGVDMKRLEAETQKVIDDFKKAPPSSREIERARNAIVTATVSQLQNVGGFGGKADMLNRYNQYLGDPGYLQLDLARYQTVTSDSVHELAERLLDSQHRAVVITEGP